MVYSELKNRTQNILLTVSVLVSVMFISLVPLARVYAAATATFSLQAVSSVAMGSTFTVNIYENSGSDEVFGVSALLKYNPSQIQYVSTANSSGFSIAALGYADGPDTVDIERGAFPAVTGNQLVATVTFKALAGSGSTNLYVANGSAIVGMSGTANILDTNSTASINVALTGAAVPPATTSTTSTPSGGRTTTALKPTTGTVSAATVVQPTVTPPNAEKTPPTITDIQISDVGAGKAEITWKTSEPATSEVQYGVDTKYGLNAVDNNLLTDHKITVEKLLMPGTEFHFIIKSVDAAGNVAVSPDQTFRTKNVSITITVLDENNKPIKGAKVTVGGISGITDENGKVTLQNLPAGENKAIIEHDGKKTEAVLGVSNISADGVAKPATLTVKRGSGASNSYVLPAVGVGILVLSGLVVLYAINRGGGGSQFGGGGRSGGLKNIFKRDHPVAPAKVSDIITQDTPFLHPPQPGTPVNPTDNLEVIKPNKPV